jgi:ABC-type transport system involved in cytochrome c biogenesis permease subunit
METNTGIPAWSWLVSIVIGLLFAWICARVAGGKGYSPVLFGILGFFFSCVTLIIVLLIPRRNAS